MKKFVVGELVEGVVCGFFVVLGYREIAGKEFVQVKPFCLELGKMLPGELALDEQVLVKVGEA